MTRFPRQLPLLAIALGIALPGLSAQGKTQEQLTEQWEQKQAEAWFTGGEWSADFAAAKERAKQEGKVILAYFSRSYSP